MTRRRCVLAPILVAPIGLILACATSDSESFDWNEVRDSTAVQPLVESRSFCRDCIGLERVLILGDTVGPGYVEWTTGVTRDRLGNYWVGQRGSVKVFDSAGRFVRDVGRPGKGPMEFGRPTPIYTDGDGRIHILDPTNFRETIVGPDLVLYAEKGLPGFVQFAAPLPGGDRYAVNMWLPTVDRIGLPLHVIEGRDVLYSFGVAADRDTRPLDEFTARRVLATDRSGHIFSAPYYDYLIEAWTPRGRRITGFEGPLLNEKDPLPAAFSDENPPPNTMLAIHADRAQRLWVVRWHRRPDWRDNVVEQVFPGGEIVLSPKGNDQSSVFQTQIDVIDLNEALILASSTRQELLERFVDDGLVLETQYLENGTPQLVVWKITLEIPGER